jgi:imidazolonepropionase-like amidohydrolase
MIALLLVLGFLALAPSVEGQRRPADPSQDPGPPPAPNRRPGEGEGPFPRLIIRGATMVDGTGAPPVGPVDVVIENNRITDVVIVGYPKLAIPAERRPRNASREIDATGLYLLPGFVDTHAHMGGTDQGTPAEYVFKLWMGHGVTTIRDPGCLNGVDWCLTAKRRSEANEIVAPRIFAYAATRPGEGYDGRLDTPDDARRFVAWAAEKGVDGFKIFNLDPDVVTVLISEASKAGLGTAAHLSQLMVARFNALTAARAGLTTLEHWYGLPESLFSDRTIQDYPRDYNYQDESHRFGQAGRLWAQAAAPGSEKWNAVLAEFLSLGFVFSPTLTIYEDSRDAMRARTAEWHELYTLPSLWRFYQPNRAAHGSYWFDWTTENEIDWKGNYRLWMQFLNEYKNRGGKVCTGSDSGFIYKLYGFDYIRELELLEEAGFHPLEVIRAATLCGAEALMKPKGKSPEFGTIRPGKLADLILVDGNPLHNLKLLYGTGHVQVNDVTGKVERVGGVKYTIKDGIVYDAKRLLADVRRIVAEAKRTDTTTVRTAAPQ